MERLGAGLENSGRTFQELKQHPFFKGVDWDIISSNDDLPFDKNELTSVLIESKKKIQQDFFDDWSSITEVPPSQPKELAKEVLKGFLQKRNPWFWF